MPSLAPASAGPNAVRDAVKGASSRRNRNRSTPPVATPPAAGRDATRAVAPDGTTQPEPRVGEVGSASRKRRRPAALSSNTGSSGDRATAASAKPRTQRSGSGTRFSTTCPSTVVTARSSAPTRTRSGSREPTRASAARSGGFTSTLVVPWRCTVPSRPSARRSKRAYTPQHWEKDSKRSASSDAVTTGSAARTAAATMLGGVQNRVPATPATTSSERAAGWGAATKPSASAGWSATPPEVARRQEPSTSSLGARYR